MEIVHAGLRSYVDEQIGDRQRGIGVKLVMRDNEDQVIGGLSGFTTRRNLIVEHLWLDERYRRQGLGKKLIVEAERIARENGCIASQTYGLSFQAPKVFEKIGYSTFGISDGFSRSRSRVLSRQKV